MMLLLISPDTWAAIAAAAICSAVGSAAGLLVTWGAMRQRVRSLEEWKKDEAEPMLKEHDRALAAGGFLMRK
jgi:hypothetical protein